MIGFDVSREDHETIRRIAGRVVKIAPQFDQTFVEMDLCATHANGCPLDLTRLLGFDDFNLMHDVMGINAYLDHDTGKLTRSFLPRCARGERHVWF